MSYDIIGDVHGQAGKLRALLQRLGYQERSRVWQHPDRTAIFVGDFIDPGPHQLETISIVSRMVDDGHTPAVMGNHEFNAIAWYLKDPVQEGEYLRPHGGEIGEENRRQHAAFLAEADRFLTQAANACAKVQLQWGTSGFPILLRSLRVGTG
ncbi:hypothetical protein D8I24_1226 [Cupriavidus necator H850]|uniref:metallophosphoesterase n=1 Tax=Cupriavidus necator TaxID=106590 RepID=UPI00129E722B|nr:metallophosphoesterase [Cupriavidus necator]KAI3608388.1 hypothetical protein D8I24_1226 [Cupriavidus necator H850]